MTKFLKKVFFLFKNIDIMKNLEIIIFSSFIITILNILVYLNIKTQNAIKNIFNQINVFKNIDNIFYQNLYLNLNEIKSFLTLNIYSNIFIFIFFSIIMLKISNAKKIHYYDELTGLLKRNGLINKFNLLKNIHDKIAIIFIDLDKFKEINDTYGHKTGDKFLLAISAYIKELLNGKELGARIGGDEFVIILPYETETELINFLDRLLIGISKTIKNFKDINIDVTASIGIAKYPVDSTNIVDLLKKADIAMYEVKKNGKNNYKFYNIELEKKIQKKLKLKNSLSTVIQDSNKYLEIEELEIDDIVKNNMLEVYYQPQVDKKNIVKGAEALIRWQLNDKLPPITPGEFLSIAYETGLIYDVDLYVIKSVAKQINNWKRKGYKVPLISINLSIKNLYEGNFINKILEILKKYNLTNQDIGFEITEESFMTAGSSKYIVNLVNQLYDRGFNIAIDDFGTGYSGLTYIKEFNVTKIKIDKIFIQNIPNYVDEAIIKSIVNLANNLNLEIIAEGVEHKEQTNILWDIGIDYIQGYYYSKPIKSNEFEEKILKNYNKIKIKD